jgi:large subunit ribosomal protein L18
MARLKIKTVLYRRKREQKTNYKKRLHLLISKTPRVVVRFTNTRIIAQLVEFTPTGDKVLVGLDSSALKKHGWEHSLKNFPAAYLTGLLFGKAAQSKDQKKGILDTGFRTPLQKGRTFAFLKGVLDSGFEVPHGNEELFPSEDRIQGKHIEKVKDGSAVETIKQKILG